MAIYGKRLRKVLQAITRHNGGLVLGTALSILVVGMVLPPENTLGMLMRFVGLAGTVLSSVLLIFTNDVRIGGGDGSEDV